MLLKHCFGAKNGNWETQMQVGASMQTCREVGLRAWAARCCGWLSPAAAQRGASMLTYMYLPFLFLCLCELQFQWCCASCLFAEIWNNTFITISHSALMRFHFGCGSYVLVVDDSARCVILQAISYFFCSHGLGLVWDISIGAEVNYSWLASYRIN